jgi:peptidoglycan hydrolase-like protein with peptidoglycan-binding domain
VDNIDGPITKGAVKRFQKKHGLVEDGIVGQKTRPKLEEVHGC